MAYTPEMKELIKRVEATRPARVAMARRNENYPALSMAERADVLEKFHPDYQKSGKRVVAVGPNKGDIFQEGVARLLEFKSLVRPDKVDLSKIDDETDVLVIGGGRFSNQRDLVATLGMLFNKYEDGRTALA